MLASVLCSGIPVRWGGAGKGERRRGAGGREMLCSNGAYNIIREAEQTFVTELSGGFQGRSGDTRALSDGNV